MPIETPGTTPATIANDEAVATRSRACPPRPDEALEDRPDHCIDLLDRHNQKLGENVASFWSPPLAITSSAPRWAPAQVACRTLADCTRKRVPARRWLAPVSSQSCALSPMSSRLRREGLLCESTRPPIRPPAVELRGLLERPCGSQQSAARGGQFPFVGERQPVAGAGIGDRSAVSRWRRGAPNGATDCDRAGPRTLLEHSYGVEHSGCRGSGWRAPWARWTEELRS
jgi:hypothetical protein